MSDNEGSNESLNQDDELSIQMSDKASFREKSSSFLKLLEQSSKYRKKDALPEPGGRKPGKLPDALTPRQDGCEDSTTPRLSRRPQEGGVPARRAQDGEEAAEEEAAEDEAQPSALQGDIPPPITSSSLPNTPRGGGAKPALTAQLSLPPVAGPDRRKMNDVMLFSRQGSDIHSKLRRSGGGEPGGGGYSSAPNSPSLSRGPLSARRDRIGLNLK